MNTPPSLEQMEAFAQSLEAFRRAVEIARPTLLSAYAQAQGIIAEARRVGYTSDLVKTSERIVALCHTMHIVDPPPAHRAPSA